MSKKLLPYLLLGLAVIGAGVWYYLRSRKAVLATSNVPTPTSLTPGPSGIPVPSPNQTYIPLNPVPPSPGQPTPGGATTGPTSINPVPGTPTPDTNDIDYLAIYQQAKQPTPAQS